VYIKVRVTAGAKKESFVKKTDDHFVVAVKEPAQMNRANKQVVALLADYFNIPIGKVHLVSGHHSPGKIFDVIVD
jgi:uncharacterized protein YggU (UPF0235/DUF167 family)